MVLRIAGVYIPGKKVIGLGLTEIFGIGKATALRILSKAKVSPKKKVARLSKAEVKRIRSVVSEYTVEGELRRTVSTNIKRLLEIRSWRGRCHRRRLPTRGQRTKTNARTRKRGGSVV